MGRVRVLPPTLVNRIAAGECVERPASVVKELMENALDAGACRIDVHVEDGGRALIQVTDDGCGMDRDDLELCVRPHATSKIAGDDDLFRIMTMGFRGEALPSIGSVSRLRITSRPREGEVGFALDCEGGEIGASRPCSTPPGTRVEVRDLFHNVPARRKFLKTTPTEMGQITEVFARIALAHPSVAFSLRHNQRSTHQLDGTGDRLARISDFYGAEVANGLLPVRRASGGVVLDGYVCAPSDSRGSGKWEYVFVNGRFIRDRFVSHAVREAYRGLIDPHRFPVVFLFIAIEPDQVDVNVHPTKVEVRWRDSNYIHGQVLAALRDRFLASNLMHTLRTPGGDDARRESVRQAMADFFTRSVVPPARVGVQDRAGVRSDRAAAEPAAHVAASLAPARAERGESTQRAWKGMSTVGPAQPAAQPDEPAVGEERLARAKAIQIHLAYIVAQTEDGLQIIDQHALHERILYEQFRDRVAERSLESQRLLLPEIVPAPADRIEALETHAGLLARLGIELTQTGPESVSLSAFPSFLERVDRRRFVLDLLDVLSEPGARPSQETLLHGVLDMLACKAAVKAGDPLSAEEIDELLRLRDLAERSSHCPHGRPTTLSFSLRELERQFHRR